MQRRGAHSEEKRRAGALFIVAGLWLAGCSGAHEPAQTAQVAQRVVVAPTANVPALLASSIDGLRSQLGAAQPLPNSLRNPLLLITNTNDATADDSLAAFRTGGLTLVASYNERTRHVRDLLVLGQHEDTLMGRASLQANRLDYLVLPVFQIDKPNRLLGLRVIATQQGN